MGQIGLMVCNPLPQSDAYAKTLRAFGTHVTCDMIGDHGRCMIQSRQLPVLGRVNLISRGPIGLGPQDALDYLQTRKVDGPLIVNSNDIHTPIRGFIRLASPKSAALLALTCPDTMRANLHQKWRHALTRAEQSRLGIDQMPYHPDQHSWLIKAERKQQTARRYRNWPSPLLNQYATTNPGQARVFTAREGKTAIAAMLFLCHHPWTTYHIGFTTPTGRAMNAHHLLLWRAMLWLSKRGYDTLDLGLLTGPAGLDRFKLRTGARAHPMGGTWLRLPRLQFPSIQVPSGQKA